MSKSKNPRSGRADVGRFSSRRKAGAVLRLLRGETLQAVARGLGVTVARLTEWRDAFVAGGQQSLLSRNASSQAQEEVERLRSLVGDLTARLEQRERSRELEEATSHHGRQKAVGQQG